MVRIVLAAGLLVASLHAARAGDSAPLDDAAIGAAVSGQRFAGVYDDGSAWRETYAADGSLAYEDDENDVDGQWRVISGRLCTLYATGVEGGCFMVFRRSTNCFDFYAVDPSSGMPLASEAERAAQSGWSARGWSMDKASTCPLGEVT